MKRDNIYYYIRHIPNDLVNFYSVKRLCFSLKTKSNSTALRYAKSVTQRLDDYWFGIRLQNLDVPAINSLKKENEDNEYPTLLDALELYLKLKGINKDKVFFRTAKRNIDYVIKVLGNKPLKSYSTSDGAKFRDWLIEKGMNINTVKRVFSSVRSIVNIAISEVGLDCNNGFSKTYFPQDNNSKTRKPLPLNVIKELQLLCKKKDDEIRWLFALLSDSGMRLGEAVGLLKSDIKLDSDIPHIELKPHSWRSLKTKGSERNIPVVGSSLWACKRILESNNNSIFAFPKYTNQLKCNSNSASAALNKWLKEQLTNSYQVHGLRHSMRDRLRAVECPSELIDQICGWSNKSVGEGYGKGYDLKIKYKWIKKL